MGKPSHRISVWLVPPPKASQALEAVIASVASRYKSPKFQPHITLLSFPATPDIDPNALLPPRAQLPSTVPITFQEVCTGKTYFQSVLIELEKREDSVLQALYNQVKTFTQKNRGDPVSSAIEGTPSGTKPFYPHLSLYYGEPPMEVKEEIIDALAVEGAISISGPLTVGGVEGGFHVSEIWVVRTEGPVEGWEVLQRVKLEGMEHSPQEV
ncbi:hypothetical protein FRC01_003097 [Tulasnella sp. 417]|nr:hypothetical protein FRC01_003097 [Tulasnella sp. 417]